MTCRKNGRRLALGKWVIARQQNRWLKIASVFPVSPTVRNTRGINKTDWIRLTRQVYDSCIDTRDYRQQHA